jgi:acetylornithine deacetylase/succinyl-diaminopimelate desuccinylase-like protein
MPAIWSPRWADGGLPGAANVIPGEVRFTLDVRSGDAARRDRAAEAILDAIRIAGRRGLDVGIERSTICPPPLRSGADGSAGRSAGGSGRTRPAGWCRARGMMRW